MSTTEGPADTLRRAAKLMLERSELVPPPPWYSAVHDVTTYDGLDVIASSGLTVRAEYVASWHPGVAVAVASWLQLEAADYAVHGEDAVGHYAYALDVARTYLGEAS